MKSVDYKRLLYANKIIIVKNILAIIFLVSFVYKIVSHEDFVEYIANILNIEYGLSIYLSNIIIGIELYLVIQLFSVSDRSTRIISQSILLLIVFTMFAFYLLIKNEVENCFCFGYFLPLFSLLTIIKNTIIIVLVSVACKDIYKRRTIISLQDIVKVSFTAVLMFILFARPSNISDIKILPIEKEKLKYLLSQNNVIIIDARKKDSFIAEI